MWPRWIGLANICNDIPPLHCFCGFNSGLYWYKDSAIIDQRRISTLLLVSCIVCCSFQQQLLVVGTLTVSVTLIHTEDFGSAVYTECDLIQSGVYKCQSTQSQHCDMPSRYEYFHFLNSCLIFLPCVWSAPYRWISVICSAVADIVLLLIPKEY